jgi:membrane-bound lytic murein transglycosylase B
VRRLRVERVPESKGSRRTAPPAALSAERTASPSASTGLPSGRTTRTLVLPVLLVGCLGALALPAAIAIPYASHAGSPPAPAAAAAMVLPPGVREEWPAAEVEERGPTRSFVTVTPTPTQAAPEPTAGLGAAPDAAPVDVAAVEAQAQVALSGAPGATDGQTGIPVTVLAAYRKAEANLAAAKPSCHLPWWLVAGVGRVESGHAFGGRVDANGNTRGRIMGPLLDGSMPGTAVIRDTDGGKWDGDATFDRGIGPMGFLPGSWAEWGKDGNGDKVADPNNVFDAATAAGYLLCSVGDLSDPATMAKAVLRYNQSASYVKLVLTWAATYRDGVTTTADSSGTVPAAAKPATPPPTATPLAAPSSSAPPRPATSSTTAAPPPSTTTAPPSTTTTTTTTAPTTTTTTASPTTTTTTTAPRTTTTTTTSAPAPASTTTVPTSG